jgi:HEAT repeat protein
MARKRKLLVGLLSVVVGVSVWVGLNLSVLRAKYATQRLISAKTDEERAQWADQLVNYGTPGFDQLVAVVKSGEEAPRVAAFNTLNRHLDSLPNEDARAIAISGTIVDAFASSSDSGKRVILQLMPVMLKRTGSFHADQCRAIVAEGLKLSDLETRLAAVRLAIHPEIRLNTELMPLLESREPELRGATLFAVAVAIEGEPVLRDEELFRWLHDPDPNVRKVCHDALVGRDRSDVEITLGRRFTHPDARERLKLLLDLRYDDDVADPEPWLERLSRDPEPAVRAGAARVMVELANARKMPCPVWVTRVADVDAHPTVRFIANYYRMQPTTPPNGVIPAIVP